MPRVLHIIAGICIAIPIILYKRPTTTLAGPPTRKMPKRTHPSDLAPLHACDNPTRLPHEDFVFLHLGHSLVEHKLVLGDSVDLDSAIVSIAPEKEAERGLYYSAKLSDTGLTTVRADVGVGLVECDLEVHVIG